MALQRWPRTAYFFGGVLLTWGWWWLLTSVRVPPAFVPAMDLAVWAPFVALFVLVVARWRGRKNIRPLPFGAGAVLVYAFVFIKLLFGTGIDAYLHRRSFESADWKRNERRNTKWPPRISMVDDLLAHYQLRGLTRDSLERLLGPRDSTPYFEAPNNLVYWLGPERGFMSIDSEWLVVTLGDDGRVRDVRILRD